MHMVGLFDLAASGDCLAALRRKPLYFRGSPMAIVDLDEGAGSAPSCACVKCGCLAPRTQRGPLALDAIRWSRVARQRLATH